MLEFLQNKLFIVSNLTNQAYGTKSTKKESEGSADGITECYYRAFTWLKEAAGTVSMHTHMYTHMYTHTHVYLDLDLKRKPPIG